MNPFFALIKKEVFHILRDKRTLLVLFGIPIIQIILFGFALSNEVKNSTLAVLDMAKDENSIRLIDEFRASKYFDLVGNISTGKEVDAILRKGKAKIALIIPENFSRDLTHQHSAQIQFVTDGTNPNLATTLDQYASIIVNDFQKKNFDLPALPYEIDIKSRMLYNPQLKGSYIFVPGVIAFILMLICTMMTSVSVVREKEMGNMEILLASPMNPLAIIFSKAVPYLVLSLIILTTILGLSVMLLDIPIKGSLLLLYGVSMLFILAALSIGLAISTIADSQQSAMMISLIGLLLPTMMLSGFLFPIESMPLPLRIISNFIPAKWYFFSIQGIMIKGQGFHEVANQVYILIGFVTVFLTVSITKFKIRLA